jgi:L,D-peptidoglycan transpeptidase YkuD (ErfK/YbiS/YcfS/YnhG family)
MTISRRLLFRTAPAALALAGLPATWSASAGERAPAPKGPPAGGLPAQFVPPLPPPLPPAAAPPAPAPPGIGPAWAARIPLDTRQLLVVVGEGPDSDRGTASLWSRDDRGWLPNAAWPAHNGHRGWTGDHHEGDLRSPVGVYSLTDAGGLLPDPGTRLPYDRSDGYAVSGTGFAGEELAGTFDHVIAIDYNRVAGRPPRDTERPRGDEFGGGIWLHIDHGGATHGCVTLPHAALLALLAALDPAAHPMVAMGDAAALAEGGPAS